MRSWIAWKRRIGRLYASMRARDSRRKLILLYHSVGGGAASTDIETFRQHLHAIVAIGRPSSLPKALASTPINDVAVAITFDDGYATLRDHASTILADFGCTATAFLNTGEISNDERRPSRAADGYYPDEQFLAWRDVDALVAAGWEIGSHGVGHFDLAAADSATTKNELSASKLMIEERLGVACHMFAYTWGRSNSRVRAEVRSAGYRYGFTGDHGRLTEESDPFALPRINVANDYSRDDLTAILRGDWDYLHWVLQAKAVME
jgi:peptidoglycan/xylan/chitin deacetylase (PgdA/CDA1 family)